MSRPLPAGSSLDAVLVFEVGCNKIPQFVDSEHRNVLSHSLDTRSLQSSCKRGWFILRAVSEESVLNFLNVCLSLNFSFL